MNAKPLYLEGGDTKVRLDGPALKVLAPARAAGWFPLRRVSRVVSARQVDWALDALLACAEAGITVQFVDSDGTLVARCLGPYPVDPGAIGSRLERLWQREDGISRYGDWRRATERMAVRSVLRRAGLAPGLSPRPRDLRQCFFRAAREAGQSESYRCIGALARSALSSLVGQHWTDLGVDAEDCTAHGVDLVGDCTAILFWDLELPRAAWLEERLAEGRATEVPARREIVTFFERRRPRLEYLLRGLTRRFHHWLIEVVKDAD
ncbi:MAG TPA: CRISPR-associated endonuclease Cas1 [Methylococcus sp.]|nr:CRISPR-associated endonuclease Cas1 [Methylococcus sp.]